MGTPFEPTQEVRLAVVLYGGVSLAIYMNGVAQELYHLVRATAPAEPMSAEPASARPGGELGSTELVYRQLGQILHHGGAPVRSPLAPGPDDPVRTRFVVDILSGSSAGGINGIFLAKALANDQHLDQLKRLWVEEGDIARLLNDRASLVGTPGLRLPEPPQSLLNGRRMYHELLRGLDGMDAEVPARPESPFVEELDLAITTTDLRGLDLPIKLFDSVVYEPRHRNVFRFAYRTLAACGEERNDFTDARNPLLAFAARCTSAFPFAFEPMTLTDIDPILAASPTWRLNPLAGSGSATWAPFFPDYVRAGDDFTIRAFGDGGELDNKPFSYAIDSLARRRSTVPVDRKLIYIEPDPAHPERDPVPVGRPNPLASTVTAVTLSRNETIREDLERVREHNRVADRVREVTRAVDGALAGPQQPAEQASNDPWLDERGPAALQRRGLAYAAYHRLKVQQVADDLGALVVRVLRLDEDSDRSRAVHLLVQAWVALRYADPYAADSPGDPRPSENQFLLDFDLGYRLRRINFLERRADELLRMDELTAALLAATGQQPPDPNAQDDVWAFREALLAVKRSLNEAFVGLRRFRRDLPSDPALPALIEGTHITSEHLDAILVGPPAERVLHSIHVAGDGAAAAVDFTGRRTGEGRNPCQENGFTFTVHGTMAASASASASAPAAGAAAQPPALTTRTVAWQGTTGLDAGARLLVNLPGPTGQVELQVSSLTGRPTVQATDGSGETVEGEVDLVDPGRSTWRAIVRGPGITRVEVTDGAASLGAGASPADRARGLLQADELREPLGALADLIAARSHVAFVEAAGRVDAALDPDRAEGWAQTARRCLRALWHRFDDYDVALFPVVSVEGGEAAPVDVLRISPDDATSLIDTVRDGRRKLAGTSLHHFGAFLDPAWRRNDIMWGRLDAAERLITALLPGDHPLRASLLEQAQLRIVVDELGGTPELRAAVAEALLRGGGDGPADPGSMLAALEREGTPIRPLVEAAVLAQTTPEGLRGYLANDYRLRESVDPKTSLETATRSVHVVGRILDAMAHETPGLRLPSRLLTRFARFTWGLVEISMPGSLAGRLARFWLQFLVLVEAFLIVVGTLLGQPGAVRLGWLALGLTLGLGAAKALLGAWLRGPRSLWLIRGVAALVALLVLALASVGAVRVLELTRDRVCRSPRIVRDAAPWSCPQAALTSPRPTSPPAGEPP